MAQVVPSVAKAKVSAVETLARGQECPRYTIVDGASHNSGPKAVVPFRELVLLFLSILLPSAFQNVSIRR
jgi:hypothetical protein